MDGQVADRLMFVLIGIKKPVTVYIEKLVE